MRTLYLMRHAKSSWDDASVSDFDRPLNARGERAAPFMGRLMKERGMLPGIIVSSPALRARRTAEVVREAAEFDGPFKLDDRIYEASPHKLVQVLTCIADEFSQAMLVGHNPGMEGLVRYLTGEIEPMPTAALAVIVMKIANWNEADAGCGELIDLIRPRAEMEK